MSELVARVERLEKSGEDPGRTPRFAPLNAGYGALDVKTARDLPALMTAHVPCGTTVRSEVVSWVCWCFVAPPRAPGLSPVSIPIREAWQRCVLSPSRSIARTALRPT